MSRLFEALSGLKAQQRTGQAVPPQAMNPIFGASQPARQEAKPEHHTLKLILPTHGSLAPTHGEFAKRSAAGLEENVPETDGQIEPPVISARPSRHAHLVALTDPQSLGAEKFRALATRFDHLCNQHELKSFQVTSSVIEEGKTLVSGNIAVTLAKYSGSKTLLVEGDLHRPALAKMFGLGELSGISNWWSNSGREIEYFVYRLSGMPLWFLPAGRSWDQPADILRSERFQKAFRILAGQFERIVVDSTPMLPIVDVNLWSKLVDGTLLVVRHGVTPVKALKQGLQALDQPKLIGIVSNEAAEFNHVNYNGHYYGKPEIRKKPSKRK